MRKVQRCPPGQISLQSLLCGARPAKDEELFDAVEGYHSAYCWLQDWTDEAAHQLETRGRVKVATRVILRAAIVSLKGWRRTVSKIPARSVRGMMAKALVVADITGGRI